MEIVLRASVIFLFVWLVTKALGRRELAQMSSFELVLLIVVGDLVQQGATQDDRSLGGAALAVSTIALWILAMSFVATKSERAARVLEGVPVVIISAGRLLPDALRANRLSEDEVTQEARNQGIDDLARVRVGVLEPDGRFSFLQDGQTRTDAGTRRPIDAG
jgi:uncharacterized membrane protein YcaP (DUF421 family)